MMKKIIMTVTVVALLGLIGCAKKTENSGNNVAKGDAVAEAEAENVVEDKPVDEVVAEDVEITEESGAEDSEEVRGLQAGVYQCVNNEEMEGDFVNFYYYLIIKDDNTGFWSVQDIVPITWNDMYINDGGTDYEYSVEGDCIVVKEQFGEMTYEMLDVDIDEFMNNMDNPEYMFYLEEASRIPNTFVDEVAGKVVYDSYDEVISYLTSGQGYAYVKLEGYDGDVLVVSNSLYEYEEGINAAMDCAFYAIIDGKAEYVTAAASDGTARPIAIGDGIILFADQHDVGGDFFTEDGRAIMAKFYAYESFEEGSEEAIYGGFFRDVNSFDISNEKEISTEEEYLELYQKYLDADVIDFTIIE